MRHKILITSLSVLALFAATPVYAGGVGGALKEAASLVGEPTVGSFISGYLYGNTSNPSGNGNGVLPSLAPGPWKCTDTSDCAGPTTAGGSMGEFIAPAASGGNGSPDFANGGDGPGTGPDFSDN